MHEDIHNLIPKVDTAPSPESAAPRVVPAASWSLTDILSVPVTKSDPLTRVFNAAGRFWPVTIRTDALTDPEEFYSLALMMTQQKNAGAIEVKIEPPYFVVKNPQYIAALNVLMRVCVSPSLSFDEWAEFGRRVGGKTISDIVNFALEASGLSEKQIDEEMADAGEPTGAAL